jgi:dolichol kinase
MRAREPELERQALDIARRTGRELDLHYWKHLYFEMIARELERKKHSELLQHILFTGGFAAAALLLAKLLLQW